MLVRNVTFRQEVSRESESKYQWIFSQELSSSDFINNIHTSMSADVRSAAVTFFSILIAISVVIGTSGAAKFTNSLTVSKTKSVPSDIITSSRQKRAPGWGKRAPGWGKRAPGWGKRGDLSNDVFDPQEAVVDNIRRIQALKSNSYLPEDVFFSEQNKRAPGWGKRSCDNDAYPRAGLKDRGSAIPHWGKRNSGAEQEDDIGIERRAPGWGKRSYEEDLNNADRDIGYDNLDSDDNVDQQLFDNSEIFPEPMIGYTVLPGRTLLSEDLFSVGGRGWAGKRAPGWGKRNYKSEDAPIEKRAPGWGKRAPGWGKRAPGWGKRAPGWGKRAPGWGKRNFQMEAGHEDASTDKRAPGWGKRAPGWGKRSEESELDEGVADKRAPGWGKRATTRVKRLQNSINFSTEDNCDQLQFLESAYIARIQELAARRSAECGNRDDANKLLGTKAN